MIELPAARAVSFVARNPKTKETPQSWAQVCVPLSKLGAIELVLINADQALSRLWRAMMREQHPQGDGPLCGAQLRYLIRCKQGVLGGLSFSAAAWQVGVRDQHIGWTGRMREQRLPLIVNNSRFLILNSVQVKNLASHVLGLVSQRLSTDWFVRYGVRPVLLETFVDTARYAGTCYRAANWVDLGLTQGRGRQDAAGTGQIGRKHVLVYALERNWHKILTAPLPWARIVPGPRLREPADWAEEEFGRTRLSPRLTQRVCRVARDFYARPQASIPQACDGEAARIAGTYRLLAHEDTNIETLLQSHYAATEERLAQRPGEVILAVQDTTSVNYTKLVEDYEKARFAFDRPDPVEAILFRMAEQGLRQKDIAEILGGKNRASEVLSRKRPLTLPMIRALYEKLRIPPELLIQEPGAQYRSSEDEIKESDIPVDLLIKRGWAEGTRSAAELLKRFLAPAASPVLLRHTLTFGANSRSNRTHVWLWLARVREIADSRSYLAGKFKREEMSRDLLRYVAKLSWMDKGPRQAKEFLEQRGIAVVIEPHLPSTHLDGAATSSRNGVPVVALTLREDRLDNFWFTLIHELVHVWKHLDDDKHRAIVDENIEKSTETEAIEREANQIAGEVLIPHSVWRRSDAFVNPSTKTIRALAAKLQISPAIVAGRVRFERQNYAMFSGLIGRRQVRVQFPEVRWG